MESEGANSRSSTGGISATVGLWSGAPNTVDLPDGKYVPGPHSLFGSTLDLEGQFAETNDRYVRMAWDTGGAAWDLGVINGIGTGAADLELVRTRLRDAFLDSLGNQIKRQHDQGRVFREGTLVSAVNYGWTAGVVEGFLPEGPPPGINLTTPLPINTDSNAVPFVAGTSTKVHQVFQSARTQSPSTPVDVTINSTMTGGVLEPGAYIVELLFADITSSDRAFRVALEGTTVLENYKIHEDFAKIKPSGDPLGRFFTVEAAGKDTAVVKRFHVDVSSNNGQAGLQILLSPLGGTVAPLLSGVRVLKAPPSRIENVIVKGSSWAPGVDYSFATLVGLGEQLRPLPTQNANTIEIHFDGPVSLNSSALTLVRTTRHPTNVNGFPTNTTIAGNAAGVVYNYNPVTYVATWKFPANTLVDGKYAVHLNSAAITGGGQALDGDWTTEFGFNPNDPAKKPTADVFGDDAARPFAVGNGVVGGTFMLSFGILTADYTGDGVVDASDASALGDGNGDGVVNAADSPNPGSLNKLGNFLPLRKIHGADLHDDEIVSYADLTVFRFAFNTGVDGDIDGDGFTQGSDLLIWQVLLGSKSAWSSAGVGAPALIGPAAPRVSNIVVSGSQSTHAAFSFDGVDGSGMQLRTVPVGGADTISIVFSENVNVGADHLFVVGLQKFNLPELAAFSYDATTYTATWRFEGWALGDQYALALDEAVTDVEGNWLDGEWTNPNRLYQTGSSGAIFQNAAISEFPSGNGAPGGMFAFVMTLLPGDADLDGQVNGTDFSILAANYGATVGKLFTQADFNGDGAVNAADWDQLALNFSVNLQMLKLKGDLNGDWAVTDADTLTIANNIGMTGATLADGDLDGDGEVSEDDLDLAFSQYGVGGLFLNVVS